MGLALYRRHRRECKAGYPEDLRSSEYDERRKGWKRCECPILVSGTLARKFRRQATGQWEWEPARAVAAGIERAGSWEPLPAPLPAEKSAPASRVTVSDATDAFLAKCKSRNIQPTTFAKYQTFINQLSAYCEHWGYHSIHQLTVSDMDRFYASWKDGIRGKAKKLDRLKGFVKFCIKRKWIAEDICEDLKAPRDPRSIFRRHPLPTRN